MAEAVRPKKKKSKHAGKPQDKKQSEGINKTGRSCPTYSGAEDTSQPVSSLTLSTKQECAPLTEERTIHLCGTQKEPDGDKRTESLGSERIQGLLHRADEQQTEENKDEKLSVENDSFKVQHRSADLKPHDDVSVFPVLYPSLTQGLPVKDQHLSASDLYNLQQMHSAVLTLTDQASLPPNLVLSDSLKAEREKIQEKLYPDLSKLCSDVSEFTEEEQRMWEHTSWLKGVGLYAKEFESTAHQEGHELYDLLQIYWRSCQQLSQAEVKLQTANLDCRSAQSQLWTFRDEQITLQAVCADQTKVYAYHSFQQAVLNKAALAEIQQQFQTKKELLYQTIALHTYTTMLSRLQVESYLYHMLSKHPITKNVAVVKSSVDFPDVMEQTSSLKPLKDSISVLFCFTRRILENTQFREDIHMWLQMLVSVLHRVGSLGEHLYLLNHLLCCPSGVGEWAASFLQIKVLENPSGVEHFIQALAILMSPVRNRANFLCHLKPCESKNNSTCHSGPGSGNWTLVDEGGEEDEDPETSWFLLSEDDLIAFFSQFPFDELFKHFLEVTLKGEYSPQARSSTEIMEAFVFTSCLVELLAFGLRTYNRARYRRFVKSIGHMIRMALCYISDHWAQYRSLPRASSTIVQEEFSMVKLQMEFDQLFFRAVLHVLKAKRLGVWLFMSEMPYGTLSSAMLWRIYYVMQCAETENAHDLTSDLSIQVRESECQERFECWLSEMNNSDAICLLTTLARMAETKHDSTDPEFVKTIVLKIYEVSYVSVTTRESFSKVGRELLAAIATAHPHVISVLLDRLQETIAKVGMVSLYLFKELPLHLWSPVPSELGRIRSWLLDYSLITVENKLACIILESLNWGFLQDGSLALDSSLHIEVSLLVLEAYQKYLSDKPYEGIISEGIRQVSYVASVVRLRHSPEASFSLWAWDLLLRLKLHETERCPQSSWIPGPSVSTPVLELSDSSVTHPVLKAVKAGLALGCYLAMSITTIGHSLEKFCSEGLDLLWTLLHSRQLRAVVQVLENFLPLAYPYPFYLVNNEQFLRCIQLFLQMESGSTRRMGQQVAQKIAPHLTKSCCGENVKHLNSVIQVHVSESSKTGRVGPSAVLEFWVQVLTSQDLWYKDNAILYIMDHLCQVAVLYRQEECVQKLLYQQHKKALGYHGDRGLLSSLVSWLVAGNITPSFLEGNALTHEVWFAWLVLNMEAMFEEDSQLRLCVEHELLSNPVLSPDQALKKAQARLKLPVVPSLQRMMVYRWAEQALATPADHALLPLVWQKFLQLYLRQPGPELGLEASGCIGRRYFHNSAHTALLKELKQRLVELSDFHHTASKALKVSSTLSDEGSSSLDSCTLYITSPELHVELVRLFNVFAVWLEDGSFQRQKVYLPSLPKHYDPHRLAKIMQNQQELWMEFVDIERVQHEHREVLGFCKKMKEPPLDLQNSSNTTLTDFLNPQAARERILINLRNHKRPHPATELVQVTPPVPDISPSSLSDENVSSKLLREDLSKLQQQAKLAVLRETQQIALDSELLENFPRLYVNREEQVTMQLECRGTGARACQGPASITVTFEGLHKLEPVQNQIRTLKSNIRQLQTDSTKQPPQGVVEAAVHVECFITALVNSFKAQASPAIQKVGVAAFYQLVSFVTEDTQQYPPTRQFFSSCVEVLGQVFIQGAQSECMHMLKTVLLNRRLCTLLSPYFTPNASPRELVDMYEEVVKALDSDRGDVIFMLLTKFDLGQWLSSASASFSERSRLLQLTHTALCVCGPEPDAELLMPFNLFCKHWVQLLCYQFPDHYSDCLRLLVQSCSDQLLSPETWRVSLQVLRCAPLSKPSIPKSVAPPLAADTISLSPQHVNETVEWLSSFLTKLRLSKTDFRSFGLYPKWNPYIEEVKMFLEYLVNYMIELEMNACAKEVLGSDRVVKVVSDLDSKIVSLFKPWILVLDAGDSGPQCFPWLESDSASASTLVDLYSQLTCTLHDQFKSRMLPEQQGALWLHLMHYCQTCTAPKMPEYLLYTYHTKYRSLPWRELHPNQALMNKFFNVERGSPKSCFLFLGEVLCTVNWISVLRGAVGPQTSPADQTMVVYLFYMVVFLAKEEQLLNKPESPLLSLLEQSNDFPWHLVDVSSYQNVISYVNNYYSPMLVLNKDSFSQLTVSLLQMSAGFYPLANGSQYKDMTLKCQSFIHLMVKFLTSLDQNGKIGLSSLENEVEKLLEYIVIFNPPETELQQRHMATCSLFAELLKLLNSTGVSTAEHLGAKLQSWVLRKASRHTALALLTAACHALASVRHMARTTEACILAFFADADSKDCYSGWGPILASLQVPELTMNDFVEESLAMGSFLTLFVYILQKINLEQTVANEKKTLALLNTWINQVFPSGPEDEAKLFLWWHKALQLVQLQLDQEEACDPGPSLLSLQSRMAQLADERLSSGILGAIGWGRKSPLSSRFRVVARSMSAFLLTQMASKNKVLIHCNVDLDVSAKAQQALAVLEYMCGSKQYSEFQETLAQTCQFIRYPGHSLQDWHRLFALLVNSLYSDVHYLDTLR